MTRRRTLRLARVAIPSLGVLLLSQFASAAPRKLSERQTVELAIKDNPSLQASLLDVEQSEAEVDSAEGIFTPTFSADAGYTHTTNPRAGSDGSYTFTKSDVWTVGSGLDHRFPWGTAVGFRLEGARSTTSFSGTTAGAATAGGLGGLGSTESGPIYSLTGRASIVHPLLRGSGRDVNEAPIRTAKLSKTAAERSRDQAASSLLQDVLNGYWELWYQDRAEDIERQARDTAKRQRDEADQRIKAGALAPVELLSYETRLAQLDQSLVSTEAVTKQRSVELSRLLGADDSSEDLKTSADSVPKDLALPLSKNEAFRAAEEESPDVKLQEAQLELARERVVTAGESERSRLDLEGYVQGDSAAYREVPPVPDRFVTEPAVSVHVGITFEMPLSGQTRSADRRAASLAVESARSRLRATRQAVRSQVAAAYVTAETARRRVELAEKTVVVAAKQVEAQKARYEQGSAILLEVQQAEDSLRSAQLSVQRARVDEVKALISLEHLTGGLLQRYGNLVPKKVREAAARKKLRAVAQIGPL
ncbi:MAG: TolC family protein [Polyangiaceae bacterium]